MRLFLVFIIVLNLLYAAWAYFDPKELTNLYPPRDKNMKTLELLYNFNTGEKTSYANIRYKTANNGLIVT